MLSLMSHPSRLFTSLIIERCSIVSPTSSPSLSLTPSISPSAVPSNPVPPPSTPPTQKVGLICPDVGEESLEIVPQNGVFSIQITPNDELCTLTQKTTTNTTETLAPLARSYNGHEWESVAGPHTISFQCDKNLCHGSAPAIDQNTQMFLLTSFGTSANLKSEDIAARFLEQTTFGTTRSDILPWKDQVTTSSSSLDYSFAEWVQNQYDNVPATSFRQTFREQSTTRAHNVKNAGVPLHVCDPNTRWYSYAISRKEATNDFGSLEVTRTSDDKYYLLSVNGVPRTEIESVEIQNYGNLTVPGTYQTCLPQRLVEKIGGTLEVIIDGNCKKFVSGNPPIKFFSSNPQKPSRVLTMSSPSDIDKFIPVPGTVLNEEFLLPNGLTHSDCDLIELGEYPVYLDFGDGNYLSFDPRLQLVDNTVGNPLPDGGGKNHLLGSWCSNAPRTFLNSESCVLSSVKSTCSNQVAFSDTEISLTRDNMYAFYDLTSTYVYAVDGLQAEESPCTPNIQSRWERINDSASCPEDGETIFPEGDETDVTLKTMLENSDFDDFWLRDILYTDTNQQCEISSSTPTTDNVITIIADSACWKLVHPDHYNVYDMSSWVSVHPGGSAAITKWADLNGMVLLYSHPEDMSRWETNKDKFPLIGVFEGTVPFRDLSSNLQTESVIEYFGIGSSESDEQIIVCGSPDEVANIQANGETGIAIAIVDGSDDVTNADKEEQKYAVWLKIVLSANDQLRQRVAWALSQIFAISTISVEEQEQTEGYMTYYDIFVRHAFGNYFDILKEVSYSGMMSQMLTFLNNKSTQYNLNKRNIISSPDENYAREIMQLFTIGTVLLNMDGTPKLDPNTGQQVLSYSNEHIVSYARAWTGFTYQVNRGNYERKGISQYNRIDPMKIVIDWRDILPKIDLNAGYIGDSYPLCTDMPEQAFLRKGALYRLLGSSNNLELSTNPPASKNFDPTTKMISLHSSSELYNVLCSPTTPGGSDCSFTSEVKIINNLPCFGQECLVDTLNVLEVTPGIYFEYVRQPCVELSYYQNPRTVTYPYRSFEMCADPKTIVAREACCSLDLTGTIKATKVNCEYVNERVTLKTAEERCASIGQEICTYDFIHSGLIGQPCGAYNDYYHWHGSDCLLKVKVNDESGHVAIVHEPTAMIDTWITSNIEKTFCEDSINYFPVHWESANYPDASNNCGNGACSTIEDGCLCNTTVVEDAVFSSAPDDTDDIISRLHIGSVSPDTYDGGYFDSPVNQGDYQVYFRSGKSYDVDTVFKVEVNTHVKYYKNIVSTVEVIGANGESTSFSFRNPPHFINFQVPDIRDAQYETDAVLESYYYHPNMAPFIASYMIQKFGISNPSPRYVEAVATAFKTGVYDYNDELNPVISYGTNKYGDLKSTIAAIILDRESRSLVLDYDSSKGSLREPLLKVVAFMRSMEYEAVSGFRRSRGHFLMDGMTEKIGQMAFGIESVFSFFRPDFSPMGPIAEALLVSPEAQRYMTPSVVGFINGLFALIKWGLRQCFNGFGSHTYWCHLSTEGDHEWANGALSLVPEDPSNYADAVDELATLLTAGRLSTESRSLIVNEMAGAADAAAAYRLAQQLIGVSPEFHSTNFAEFTGEDREPPPSTTPSSNPFKAVVYILAEGGMDSFNMLVPHSGCTRDMYTEYATVRSTIAIAQNKLMQIGTGGVSQVCTTFGIHPDLPILEELYGDTDLSFFANVGVLFEEVTKADWTQKTSTQLFAHNVQQKDTMQIDPYKNVEGTGVLGRMADVLTKNGYSTGSYSISGATFALFGEPQKSPGVNYINNGGVAEFNLKASIDDMDVIMAKLNNPTTTMSGKFGKTWSDVYDTSIRQTESLFEATNSLTLATNFPSGGLGKDLEEVSKVIKARDELGNDRQFFFVNNAGWDTHSEQDEYFGDLLSGLNNGISAFRDEMLDQGLWDSVTVVVASDFGRTLGANSNDGTDHAWGGNYFVLGGSMTGAGGKILGEYPDDLTSAGPLNIGNGRFIPTTSWDAIFNAVAEWTGVTEEADLLEVLPNRNTFSKLFTRDDLFKADPVVE